MSKHFAHILRTSASFSFFFYFVCSFFVSVFFFFLWLLPQFGFTVGRASEPAKWHIPLTHISQKRVFRSVKNQNLANSLLKNPLEFLGIENFGGEATWRLDGRSRSGKIRDIISVLTATRQGHNNNNNNKYNRAGRTRLLPLQKQVCRGNQSACVSGFLLSTALSLLWVCAQRALLCNKSAHVTLARLNADSSAWLQVFFSSCGLCSHLFHPTAVK